MNLIYKRDGVTYDMLYRDGELYVTTKQPNGQGNDYTLKGDEAQQAIMTAVRYALKDTMPKPTVCVYVNSKAQEVDPSRVSVRASGTIVAHVVCEHNADANEPQKAADKW